jgi:hypothetical protein
MQYENPYLFFHIDLRPSSKIIDGRMQLMDGAKIIERYIATSGLPQWQQRGDHTQKARGPIPRPDKVGIQYYEVSTTSEYVPDVPGISGEFFPIFPTEVELADGRKRSHFGIHVDANTPGSAGCPVIVNPEAFDAFCERMKALGDQGFATIPLQIDYPI